MHRTLLSLIIVLTAAFASAPAMATCSSYPYTLTNGQPADADQVMHDFNCAAKTSGDTMDSTTFTGTTTFSGPVVATGTITPSSTNGIVGTTLGNSANAGSVGEYISSTSPTVPVSTLTATNATSVSLTAGDWDCSGYINESNSGSQIYSAEAWISTVSATAPSQPNGGMFYITGGITTATNGGYVMPIGMGRINISTTTTVYLSGLINFGGGTMGIYGFIGCRRAR